MIARAAMDFDDYQRRAVKTRQKPATKTPPVVISLLGLAGEAGELLTEYKKAERDGAAHTRAGSRRPATVMKPT